MHFSCVFLSLISLVDVFCPHLGFLGPVPAPCHQQRCSGVHSGSIWPKSALFPVLQRPASRPTRIFVSSAFHHNCPALQLQLLQQSPAIIKGNYDSHLWWVSLSNSIQGLLFIWFKWGRRGSFFFPFIWNCWSHVDKADCSIETGKLRTGKRP